MYYIYIYLNGGRYTLEKGQLLVGNPMDEEPGVTKRQTTQCLNHQHHARSTLQSKERDSLKAAQSGRLQTFLSPCQMPFILISRPFLNASFCVKVALAVEESSALLHPPGPIYFLSTSLCFYQ